MSIGAFFPDGKITFYTDAIPIVEPLLAGLELTSLLLFEEAELQSAIAMPKSAIFI